MELTYRTYTQFNELIAGKVAVASSKEFSIKLTAQFPDFPGLQLPSFPNFQTSVKDSIIGRATGFYRIDGNNYLIEIELFNHAWHPYLGLPIRKVELISSIAYNFNDPDLRFMLDDAAKGYRVYKDQAHRDRRIPPVGRILDPDYLLYSEPKKWDEYFEAPDTQEWNYSAIDRIKTMLPYMIESNGYNYIPATSVGFEPCVFWNGGIPVEVRIIAHISNPAVTLTTPGVIVGPEGWDAGVAGFSHSPKRVFGLAPGTEYYIRTYIKAVRVTGESIETEDEFEYYSDPVKITTPEERINPVLVFGASNAYGLTNNSFAMRVSFEYIGDYTIEEAGVCFCLESLNRPPVISDLKATTMLRDEFGYDEVLITGLISGTTYRLRTYVKLTTGEVVYPSEYLSYHYIRNRGNRYEYGVNGTIPSINMKALVTTSGTTVTLGSVVLNQLFWAAPDRVSAKITLNSLGGSATWSMGVCFAKAPEVPTVDSSKVVAVIDRGYYEPNYVDITGLDPNSEYNFRAYVTNLVGTAYSDGISFKTQPGVERKLSFRILPVNKVTMNSAEIGIVVTDADGITSKGIYWKQGSATPSSSDNAIIGNAFAGELKSIITGLLPETTYTYIGFVVVDGVKRYTDPVSFITLAEPVVKIPTIELISVNDVTSTSARAVIKVVENGGADITGLGVVIALDVIPETKAPSFYKSYPAEAQQSGELVVQLTGLATDTKFYVAAYAINSKGFAFSNQTTFKTSESIQIPTVELLPFFDSSSTATSVSVDARITSSGGGELLRAGVVWSKESITAGGTPEEIENLIGVKENMYILQVYPGMKSFNIRLTNLDANSTYFYALFVKNETGYGWTEVGEFITPEDTENDTSITCFKTTGENSITLKATINTTIGIREVGYMIGTSLSNLTKVKVGESLEFSVNFSSDRIGTYYLRAYVTTSDGKTTLSETFILNVDTPIDDTVSFSPPSDIAIKNYSYMFDGVVRRWRRNKENGWERIYNNQITDSSQKQKAIQTPQKGIPAQTSEQIIAALTARVAQLERKAGFSSIEYVTSHFSRTAYIEEYNSVNARFVIQLDEDFKFSVNVDLKSENLTVRDEQGIFEFEDLSWNAEPNTLEIWWDFEIGSFEHTMFLEALASIKEGSRLVIYAENKGNLRRALIEQYAVIFSDDIYFPNKQQELTSVINALHHRINDLELKLPQKYYECIIQQFSTNNPAVVHLGNTITPESLPVWTRVSQGVYRCNFGGTGELFNNVYCVQANQNFAQINSQDSYHIELEDVQNNAIDIAVVDNATGNYYDNLITNSIYLRFIAL